MSWHCVPASAGWSSDCTSPSPEQIQSYLSSKTNSAAACSLRAGQASRSGTMSPLLMGDPGPGKSTLSLVDSPVSPGASPANASDCSTPDGFGPILQGSFAKWDPASCSWKTRQASLLEEASPLFSGRWPRSGLLLRGHAMSARDWVPPISGNGLQSWPTALSNNCKGKSGGDYQDLCKAVETWAWSLPWPTPCASSSGGNKSLGANAVYRPSLNSIGRLWNTPIASEDEGTGYRTRGTPKLKGQALEFGHQVGMQTGNFCPESSGLPSPIRLNSRFVEWLMGFPHGWSFPDEPVSPHWETLTRQLLAQLRGLTSKAA